MKKIILSLGVLLLTIALYAQKPFDLKTGDILFQTNKARTSFVKAIENVTTSLDDLNFSHVGVVLVEDGQVFVLEATQPDVCKTPLEKFLKQAKSVNGNPVVVVGRLKPKYQKSIPRAIEILKSFLGKPYDYVFLPDNDKYYCSEIIYLAFCVLTGSRFSRRLQCHLKTRRRGKPVPCGRNISSAIKLRSRRVFLEQAPVRCLVLKR